MKYDISTREDVQHLVSSFYSSVRNHEVLGPVFNAEILDWDKHLLRIVDFWCTMLLNETSYLGNPMRVHDQLFQRTPFKIELMTSWVQLFNTTVDQLYSGPIATLAKVRAENIAQLMLSKFSNS